MQYSKAVLIMHLTPNGCVTPIMAIHILLFCANYKFKGKTGMKKVNLSKTVLILAAVLLPYSTIAMASDQQSVGDAEVTFEVT